MQIPEKEASAKLKVPEEFSRTAALLGEEALQKLREAKVAVFGVGGVGGYVVEALARSGIGSLTLIDSDTVSLNNINRQIIALHSTVGQPKVTALAARVKDIAPNCSVTPVQMLYLPENADSFDISAFDYIVDAVDNVSAKIELATRAEKEGVKIISSMGMGNKLDPTAIEVSDIYKTSVCPLARVMRRELKARGVKKLKCVYSKEPPVKTGARTPSSCAFVPSAAGLIIASQVVKDIIYGE